MIFGKIPAAKKPHPGKLPGCGSAKKMRIKPYRPDPPEVEKTDCDKRALPENPAKPRKSGIVCLNVHHYGTEYNTCRQKSKFFSKNFLKQ